MVKGKRGKGKKIIMENNFGVISPIYYYLKTEYYLPNDRSYASINRSIISKLDRSDISILLLFESRLYSPKNIAISSPLMIIKKRIISPKN